MGYQNYNPLVNKVPHVVSAWALGGVKKDDFSVFGGLHSGFDFIQHLVPFGGLLVGLKHKKFTGYLDYCLKRTHESPPPKEGETIVPVSEGDEKKVYTSHELKAQFDSKIRDDLLVFGEAITDLTSLKSLVLGCEHDLGNGSKVKVKVILFLNKLRHLTKKI